MKKLNYVLLAVVFVLLGMTIIPAAKNEIVTKEDQKSVEVETPNASSTTLYRSEPFIAHEIESPTKKYSEENLYEQFEALNRHLEESNSFERLNSAHLDERERATLVAQFEIRQNLLNKIIEKEIESSNQLLEGSK